MSRTESKKMNSQGEQEEVDNQVSEVHYELCELMSKLSTEITFEILSRLPVRDLSSYRLLSKGWYHIINSPSFITMQHNKLMKTHSPSVFLRIRCHPNYYYLIDHESLDSDVISAVTLITQRLPLPLKRISKIQLNRIREIYTCNGLLLVEAYSKRTARFNRSSFYVCNPITREHNQIPEPYWADAQTRFIFDIRFFGDPAIPKPYWADAQTRFIFDPATRVFKIIRLNFNVMQVYSSRVGEWRTIEKATIRVPPNDVLQDVFVNGALHWLGYPSDAAPWITDSIVSLRFDTEEFKIIPLPHGLDLSKEKCIYLVVLGDCLSLVTTVVGKEHVEIWMMKEYGLQTSWDKKYIIQDMKFYRPITLMPNGEILRVSSWGDFSFYNHETKVFRSLRIQW